MEFKLEDVEETINGEIINKISNNEYLIKIQNKEHQLQILNINSNGMEFVLDNKFHNVKYVENHTAEMRIVIDGVSLTINMHTQLDKIVYKNTGNADTGFLIDDCAKNSAASSSAVPPISPIIKIDLVSGSFKKSSKQSIKLVPLTGSPPIPITVD